jgi:3-hydroxybutyryl-CoA dehydrogenase
MDFTLSDEQRQEPVAGISVGVVGGGTMGVGIAHRFAVRGATVRMVDLDFETAEAAVSRVVVTLDTAAHRERLTPEDARAAAGRLQPVASVADLPTGLDFVIEAVTEEANLKRTILTLAEQRDPLVLASNTSSISIDALARDLERPDRFAGMHFFNPVWAIDLVEVIRGSATAPETIDAIRRGVAFLGMEAAVITDSPGFASTRLGVLLGLEAIRMVEEGVAEPPDIDLAMELGYRHAMGPLRTGDLVGLDVRLAIAEHLAGVYGERFEPPALLREMVADGRLGRKTGRGFYTWNRPPDG